MALISFSACLGSASYSRPSSVQRTTRLPQLKQILAEQAKLKSCLEESEMQWLEVQEQMEIKQQEFEQEIID